MKIFLRVFVFTVVAIAAMAALAITFGGPGTPPPAAAVNEPFKAVDFSGLPSPRRFNARDGEPLAYRTYPPAGEGHPGSVVLLHGSSADSASLHPLSSALAEAGYRVYALDVRGHGDSGEHGDIDYIGQLEDDLADFVEAVEPASPRTLVGFSSGGGFALRFAGSERQALFEDYLLLSPFISQDAPTYREDAGGWASVGVPRYVAIAILNGFGIKIFNHLPVIRYGLSEDVRDRLTPSYSFALAQNYRPRRDYQANIQAAKRPVRVVVGGADELFRPSRFDDVFSAAGKDVPVTVVPGVGHIGLTLNPKGIRTTVKALEDLHPTSQG